MNNQLDTRDFNELSQDEQEQRFDWMADSATECMDNEDGQCHGEIAFRESPSGSRMARCEFHDDKRWAIHYGEPVRAWKGN